MRTVLAPGRRTGASNKVSERASGTGLVQCEPGTHHPGLRPLPAGWFRSGPGSGVSRSTFFLAEVAVQLTEQGIAILLGPVRQMRNEVLDLLAGRFAQRLDATKLSRIGLNQ